MGDQYQLSLWLQDIHLSIFNMRCPIRQFKCFLIIVLCTFTALRSIPSSICSFIGRLKYWSLTDKSKQHNLTGVSWWVRAQREGNAPGGERGGAGRPAYPTLCFITFIRQRNLLTAVGCLCKAPAHWWAVDMTTSPSASPGPPVPFPFHPTPHGILQKTQRRGSRGASDDCRRLNCCQCCRDNSDLSP